MDKNEITRIAREAGFVGMDGDHGALRRFAHLVATAEREACAEICDRFQARDVGMQPAECAGAIRARGNHANG